MLLAVDRAVSEEDWKGIRAVCALTGKAGDAVEKERRTLFSELWVGPYEKLAPQWAYVLRDVDGGIGGYLVATPETRDFRRRRWVSCELPLAARIFLRQEPGFRTEDARRFIRRFLRLEPRPEHLFSETSWASVHGDFPAHFQMSLLPGARRKGYGSALVNRLARDLKEQAIPGVHCICGEKARPFFEALEFETIEGIVFAGTVKLYLLGRTLRDAGGESIATQRTPRPPR